MIKILRTIKIKKINFEIFEKSENFEDTKINTKRGWKKLKNWLKDKRKIREKKIKH